LLSTEASTATTSEGALSAKESIKDVTEAGSVTSASSATRALLTEAVVVGAALGIAERLVCLRDVFEACFGCFITWISVRMQLARKSAIRLFNLFRRGRAIYLVTRVLDVRRVDWK
jgi:hypothetical protein